jgi:homoserine dehydrogenase
VKPVRIWLIGAGTVGTWLLDVLDSQAERLASRSGLRPTVVGLATARGGFAYHGRGLDLPSVSAAASAGRSIADLRGVDRWPSAIEGLRATEADLLVEVSASPSTGGQAGVTHMRERRTSSFPG